MRDRVQRLRERSLATRPSLSGERAALLTAFYREHEGRHPAPILRAMAFAHLCEHKTIWIGEAELIVGERGPRPMSTPTYPEITCHSLEDLDILDSREKTSYAVDEETRRLYEEQVIPHWPGRSLRDRAWVELPDAWKAAYEAGLFTEFLEQRAPGHTAADGKLYRKGLRDLQEEIRQRLEDPRLSTDQQDQLKAMSLAAEGMIRFAQRHAEEARRQAASSLDPARRNELERIARNCERVPAHAPRDLWEALQAYWFHHLGVITELNGWDSFNPGHLDQHLQPFYESDLRSGALDREDARELIQCLWMKFHNQPAPPKVGVTAAESGTYTDFANINLGGLRPDGTSGESEVSRLLLEVIDEMHLLQPSNNVQISRQTSDALVDAALAVVRKGYGFPSVFNADAVVQELLRQGKSLQDAREGGTSGCVETGAFGKEAYILTGYVNLAKLLELALCDGRDPRSGRQLGPRTGDPRSFAEFETLLHAWRCQLEHLVEIKLAGNAVFERLYAESMPAPYLSLLIDDCIAKGRDYNAGGARYNTRYLQGVGIGTLTDSLSAIRHLVFDQGRVGMDALLRALEQDFVGAEPLRQLLLHGAPRYGNDDDRADDLMVRCFEAFYETVEGRPSPWGGVYHIDMLPTTCHVYFGQVTGATPDGRHAGRPFSEGISPVQGADRKGPTAVLRSAARMDHLRTGGTLLNMKFSPSLLEGAMGLAALRQLIRGYFRMDGHHMQFNVVRAETLRRAQAEPDRHRHLIVRVAGYSDYFCDLSRDLQDEIISRTEHAGF